VSIRILQGVIETLTQTDLLIDSCTGPKDGASASVALPPTQHMDNKHTVTLALTVCGWLRLKPTEYWWRQEPGFHHCCCQRL